MLGILFRPCKPSSGHVMPCCGVSNQRSDAAMTIGVRRAAAMFFSMADDGLASAEAGCGRGAEAGCVAHMEPVILGPNIVIAYSFQLELIFRIDEGDVLPFNNFSYCHNFV
eukprot:6192299-Pleurochrysis_carterae.AAC.2